MLRALAVAGAGPEKWTRDWWVSFCLGVGISLVIALVVTVVGRRFVRRARRRAQGAGDDIEGRHSSGAPVTVVSLGATTADRHRLVHRPRLDPHVARREHRSAARERGDRGRRAGLRRADPGARHHQRALHLPGGSVRRGRRRRTRRPRAGPCPAPWRGSRCASRPSASSTGRSASCPNGSIQITSNKTRGWGRAIVDIRVALDEDPDRVRAVLRGAVRQAGARGRPFAGACARIRRSSASRRPPTPPR